MINKSELIKEINFSYTNNLDGKKYYDGVLAFVNDISCKYVETYVRISAFDYEKMARIHQCCTQGGACMLLIIEDIDSAYEVHQAEYYKEEDCEKVVRKLLQNLGKNLGDRVADILIEQSIWLHW